MSNLDTSNVIYKLGDYAVHKSVEGYYVINTKRSVVARISKSLLEAVQYIESLVTVFPSTDTSLNSYSCKLSESYSAYISNQKKDSYVVFFGTFIQETQELILTKLFESPCLNQTKKFYLNFVSLYK